MTSTRPRLAPRENLRLALVGLRAWTPRQVLAAAVATLAVGLLVGWATVLLPNPVFSREIPPVWWNYPVWVLTSVLSGMLVATYVRPGPLPGTSGSPSGTDDRADEADADDADDTEETRSSRLGLAGGVLAWFAVGCPVCNKLALLALGYGGAITWFAPVQPFLGAAALALTAVALVWRLRGQVACPAPRRPADLAGAAR